VPSVTVAAIDPSSEFGHEGATGEVTIFMGVEFEVTMAQLTDSSQLL